jgi:hypothetical protein
MMQRPLTCERLASMKEAADLLAYTGQAENKGGEDEAEAVSEPYAEELGDLPI